MAPALWPPASTLLRGCGFLTTRWGPAASRVVGKGRVRSGEKGLLELEGHGEGAASARLLGRRFQPTDRRTRFLHQIQTSAEACALATLRTPADTPFPGAPIGEHTTYHSGWGFLGVAQRRGRAHMGL